MPPVLGIKEMKGNKNESKKIFLKAVWSSGLDAGIEIRRSRVQGPFLESPGNFSGP